MDERRSPSRRRPDAETSLEVVGLLALALLTLALVTLAAASLADDPLATVTSSRLIPELVIAAIVATVLIGLTLWLFLPASPSTGDRAPRKRSPWWARPLGLVAWLGLVVVLVLVAQRLTTGTDVPEAAEALDPDKLAFVSVQAPTGDGAPQTVAELDARLAALEPVEETYVDVDDVGSIVPREAVAGGAEVVVVRLDRRADTLGGPAARSLVATLADVDRESPAELALFDADGQRLDLSLPPPTDEPTSSTERGSRLLDLAIAVGGVLVVVVLAVGVVLALVRRLRGAPYPDQARGEPDEGPRRAEQTPRPVMGGALRRARDGLDRDADPRLAIISAYWQMEQAMAEAGLPPRPAETSREFLDRCLASIGPGVDAAQRLTELFDWAMFSVHPMTEALRDDASTALLEVIDGLDRPRPAPVVEQ